MTSTPVAFKYKAPELLEPDARFSFEAKGSDLVFKWKPVGDLGIGECYRITVWMINVRDPGQRYSPYSAIVKETCNTSVSSGTLQYILYRPKFQNLPNYSGMIADAQKFVPTNEFKVRWWVTVVREDGTSLSPDSAQFQFTLFNPG